MTRLRRLIATALVDSFGLSLGWTMFSLLVVRGHGLAGLGLCNAAMLCGVALSAPAAARLSAHLDGRALLRVTAVTEAALRVGTFLLLLAGAPLAAVAVAVAASNVVAWTGYAGMRAEVAAADPRGAAMTWYMVSVAAIEAAGTATAALLPRASDGLVSGPLLAMVITCYGLCLLPTWVVAAGARVGRAPRVGGAPQVGGDAGVGGDPRVGRAPRSPGDAGVSGVLPGAGPGGPPWAAGPLGRVPWMFRAAGPLGRLPRILRPPGPLARRPRVLRGPGPLAGLQVSGGLVMLLGSGPTLLAVGLTAELHGTRWVAGSALAFALGSLLAPSSVAHLERHAIPPAVAWPALGVGMVAGWTFAAWHPAALLAAQLLSGMCMSALEGDMDARVAAGNTPPPGIPTGVSSAGNASPHGTSAGFAADALASAGHASAGHASTGHASTGHAASHGVTAGLASAAALRAFGSAAAVALAPRVIAEAGVAGLSVVLATVLAAGMVVTLAWHRSQSGMPHTGPAAHPG
jgi:hypothetical protein